MAVLWGLALLSMFLLPSDFRAGSQVAHGHSLLQLWLDAADGHIDHHHDGETLVAQSAHSDWLDARVAKDASPQARHDRPDIPAQNDSAPLVSGFHFILFALMLLPAIAVAGAPIVGTERPLAGRSPKVPLPPPRWTPALT